MKRNLGNQDGARVSPADNSACYVCMLHLNAGIENQLEFLSSVP